MAAGGGMVSTEILVEGDTEWTMLPESGNLPSDRWGPNNIISHDNRIIVVGSIS